MLKSFTNNQGLGGFEEGGYDQNAKHPTDTNWTRLSKYEIPDQPNLIWKISHNNSFIQTTEVGASFVVDSEGNSIVSSCDNTIIGPYHGNIILINTKGQEKEVFKINKRLSSPVIAQNGYVFVTTTGAEGTTGHRLYCLLSSGSIKWEFELQYVPTGRPVLDQEGNVYLYTYSDEKGTLYSINKDGELNWSHCFDSINWYESVIGSNGVIYIGLNVEQTLLAFTKEGVKLWERKLGQGLGFGTMIVTNYNTIYATLSDKLYAMDLDGNVKWVYAPVDGNVSTSPALDEEGNLYLNLSGFKLVSLDREGKERWIVNTILDNFFKVIFFKLLRA